MDTPLVWQDKVWGKTRELTGNQFYSCHELQVVAGGYCSLHFHRQRANRFKIIDAVVEIITFMGPRIERHVLKPGTIFDVPSLVPHLFAVYDNGTIYEEYYPDRGGIVNQDDIVRLIEGSKVAIHDLPRLPEIVIERYQEPNCLGSFMGAAWRRD